jgi:hypothetical protein
MIQIGPGGEIRVEFVPMMWIMRVGSRIGVHLVVLLWTAGSALAAPITITFEGIGSGTFAGTSFSDQFFIIEILAETEDAYAPIPGVVALPGNSATVFVSGFGLANVTSQTAFFVSNAGGGVGWMNTDSGLDVLDMACDIDCSTWDLTTSFGPISDPAPIVQGEPVETDLGTLILTSTYLGATMTAAVAEPPPPGVPSMGLLGGGVLGGFICLAGLARLRADRSGTRSRAQHPAT